MAEKVLTLTPKGLTVIARLLAVGKKVNGKENRIGRTRERIFFLFKTFLLKHNSETDIGSFSILLPNLTAPLVEDFLVTAASFILFS